MRNEIISPICTPAEAKRRFEGLRPTHEWARAEGFTFVKDTACYRTPESKLVSMLNRDFWTEEEQQRHWEIFKNIKGDPSNRPEIFGKRAEVAMNRVRMDGSLSPRVQAPAELARLTGGQAAIVGPYRYNAAAGSEARCELTPFTVEHPEVYFEVVRMGHRITEFFQAVLPEEYARQKEYVDKVPENMKIPGTVHTACYGLHNVSTAIHKDEFDFAGATGCITTCGSFEGNQLVLPEFRLAFDIQPDAVFFGDFHSWHGNLPRFSGGERTSLVWFVRKDMHKCGEVYGAVPLHRP